MQSSSNYNGYREYQRSAQQNGQYRPNVEPPSANTPRIPVGRCASAKPSAFMGFLKKEGYRRYLAKYNEKYDNRNPDHMKRMDEFWRAVSKEERDEFKAWDAERFKGVDPTEKRREMDRKRRNLRQNNPMASNAADLEHRRQLEQRPCNIISTASTDLKPIHVTEDFVAFCELKKERITKAIRSLLNSYRNGDMRNPLEISSNIIQFISVAPATYFYKYIVKKMSVYPAEIAVTTFHLKDGLISTDSCFVSYCEKWVNGCQEPDDVEKGSREYYRNTLGIPSGRDLTYENDLLSPCDAYHWLQTHIEKNTSRRILCDKDQFLFVFNGLQTLSTYTGYNAVHHFQNEIADQLLSIQDFADILLSESKLAIPQSSKWSIEQINEAFKFHRLVPLSDKSLYCEYHDSMTSYQRYHCAKAHTARMLHNFFRILRKNRLQDIYQYCRSPTHLLCIVDKDNDSLPQSLIAQTLGRREEFELSKPFRNEENMGNTLPTRAERKVVEDDSDSEEEEDDDDVDVDDYFLPNNDPQQSSFFSSSVFHQLEPAFGARDVTIPVISPQRALPNEYENPPPRAVSPIENFRNESRAIGTDGGYKPYGIIPNNRDFLTPSIDIKNCYKEDQQYFFSKIYARKPKYIKKISLTCLADFDHN